MNGQAGTAMAENDNAPPCSNRRARDWTAGAFAMSANQRLAAVWTEFCAKRNRISQQERMASNGNYRFPPGPPAEWSACGFRLLAN